MMDVVVWNQQQTRGFWNSFLFCCCWCCYSSVCWFFFIIIIITHIILHVLYNNNNNNNSNNNNNNNNNNIIIINNNNTTYTLYCLTTGAISNTITTRAFVANKSQHYVTLKVRTSQRNWCSNNFTYVDKVGRVYRILAQVNKLLG